MDMARIIRALTADERERTRAEARREAAEAMREASYAAGEAALSEAEAMREERVDCAVQRALDAAAHARYAATCALADGQAAVEMALAMCEELLELLGVEG